MLWMRDSSNDNEDELLFVFYFYQIDAVTQSDECHTSIRRMPFFCYIAYRFNKQPTPPSEERLLVLF